MNRISLDQTAFFLNKILRSEFFIHLRAPNPSLCNPTLVFYNHPAVFFITPC